jgi:hypothetical protein
MKLSKFFILTTLLIHPGILFGFCEDISEYSLQTFQWSEQHTNLKIRRLWVENTAYTDSTNLEYAEIDFNNSKTLWRKGYLTRSQLESMKLNVDQARLTVKKTKAKLKSLEGDLDIFARRVQATCAKDPLPIDEIYEIAGIYSAKWQEQLNNDIPEINLSIRRLDNYIEIRDYQKIMNSKGYISKRDLLDAEYDVLLMERRVKAENRQVEIKRDFIDQLSTDVL